jgi:hypothetical protein
MIYLIGGAPRTGKSILGQRAAIQLKTSWISTDILAHLLQIRNETATQPRWDAAPEAITATAEKFLPYLERFIFEVNSMAENYLVEGVNFLPTQAARLAAQYPIRCVFLGCSDMSLERFNRFPGRSEGYSFLPDELRRQIVEDVPLWSKFIQQEAQRFGYPYIDTSDDFPARMNEAVDVLTAGALPF